MENGDSLSSALAAYPKIFSDLYINMIKSGELAGSMDESLMYLANQLEKDYDLRSKIISSLTYPAFIVVALFVVGILMFIYVLPPLVSILQEQAVSLPFTSQTMMVAPSRANFSAVARPMPCAAPVMRLIFPSSRFMSRVVG